jgi:hypothetical protein
VAVDSLHDRLKVTHEGKYDEVEVGSKYVGLEFMNGSPLLNRISFYYPVANSVDLTRDYWKRGEYPSLFLGLKSGDAAKAWIGLEPWQYELTPYAVAYTRQDDTKAVTVSYDFMETFPAFRLRIVVRNLGDQPLPIELYTHLEATQLSISTMKPQIQDRTSSSLPTWELCHPVSARGRERWERQALCLNGGQRTTRDCRERSFRGASPTSPLRPFNTTK